jgi:hypothetical protein
MRLVNRKPGLLAVAALLGVLAGCATPTAAPSPGGQGGAGSTPVVPCATGDVETCYSGPEGTAGVGICKTGTRACSAGVWMPCDGEQTPGTETCNREDDDCDGVADGVSLDLGDTCETGLLGVCAKGAPSCKDGALRCTPLQKPSVEVCDTLDNDCDGYSDDGAIGNDEMCDTGELGRCASGVTVCTSVGAMICSSFFSPSPETCDGVDEDCDGVVDNDVSGLGQACNTGLKGACGPGKTACVKGLVKCVSPKPAAETCDGVDQNCDGIQDDDVCATVYLQAVADATNSFWKPDKNDGSVEEMILLPKITDVFLRFDLTSVPGNVKILSARLEATVYIGDWYSSDHWVYTHLVPDDTWGEHQITWSNKPQSEENALGAWFVKEKWLEYEPFVNADPLLIAPVEEALDSDKLISFRLRSGGADVDVFSREWAADVAQRPRLVVQYADKP